MASVTPSFLSPAFPLLILPIIHHGSFPQTWRSSERSRSCYRGRRDDGYNPTQVGPWWRTGSVHRYGTNLKTRGVGRAEAAATSSSPPSAVSGSHLSTKVAAMTTHTENTRRNILPWQPGVHYTLSSIFSSSYMLDSSSTSTCTSKRSSVTTTIASRTCVPTCRTSWSTDR